MLRHEVKDVGYFLPRESSTSCQGNGIEPDLCNLIVSFHVNVWRFVAVTRVEEQSVRPMLGNRGHTTSIRYYIRAVNCSVLPRSLAPPACMRCRLTRFSENYSLFIQGNPGAAR